ncbi:unnamed protein product [Oppiella nova]|uniref:RING-type domain-containing protein n=1 Tax=Oppiella nova TaxID=334625 RepID=A0A7R9QFT6_9ACAR|nr:unnamed protein product [Oppiella nova]CAG2164504.1 unnamed protein product [Oppiella nova]
MSGFDRSRVVGVSDEELDEYTCGICLEVFVNPVVTQCCQQTYCHECIHNWLSENNTCPNDRKKIETTRCESGAQVKCDFYANGCESVVKMCELPQHIEYCDYNANRKCKTCHLPIDGNTQHNCIDNLLIQNQSLRNENQRLKAKNNKLSMKGVISLARKDLDNYEVRSKSRMSSSEVNKCIERSQEMISLYDTYLDISTHIYNEFNDEFDGKQWHCIAFSSTGGQSMYL